MAARSITVSRAESGRTVGALLRAHFALSKPEAVRLVREGLVQIDNRPCRDVHLRLRAGQSLRVRFGKAAGGQPPPRRSAEAGRIVYWDDDVVIVDKPPGLTTMRHPHEAEEFGGRGKRFLPATLADLLPGLLAAEEVRKPGRVRAVHRLDKDTSGLVVFARTPAAESNLGRQFRGHTIERRYLAIVRGRAVSGRIESYFVPDRGDGRRGSSAKAGVGKRAVTKVRVLEELDEFTLVECRLETGRTHQVRIHLGEVGTPLCGERVYDRPPHGQPIPDASGAPRLALHAASLGFDHPATGGRVAWESPLPRDLKTVMERLRQRH